MWKSSGERAKGLEVSGLPHDALRCDACKAGDYCTKKHSPSEGFW
jgi:hypothetical protein